MLTRWSRFPDFPLELSQLRDEMERAFGESIHRRPASPASYPALNLWEDDECMFVEAELPGIELGDLDIFVNGGDQLTIQGERKSPIGDDGEWHRQECGYGTFSRMVQLPSSVDATHVDATLTDGVLVIKLPKQEEAKPRRIEVKTV